MVQELIIRILQANRRKTYLHHSKTLSSNHRFAYLTQFILDNLRQPFTVHDLSARACMSESNFFRVFKHETGLTPVEYINELRIKRAKELLEDPNCHITEVFLACGFKNRSYFNRMFKRKLGITPNEYRKSFVER